MSNEYVKTTAPLPQIKRGIEKKYEDQLCCYFLR